MDTENNNLTRRQALQLIVGGATVLVTDQIGVASYLANSGTIEKEPLETKIEDSAEHEEHHATPLTDLFSIGGTTALGAALGHGLTKGHFEGQDWSAVVTNLNLFLGSLALEEGSEKAQSEVMAILRDMVILGAINIGGAFGDKLIETKGRLGLPQTIDIPEGLLTTDTDLVAMINDMSNLILVNAPVNVASTGAAAIVFDTNLRAVTEKLMFRAPLAKMKQSLTTLSSEIEAPNIGNIELSESMNNAVNMATQLSVKVEELVIKVDQLSGQTLRGSDLETVLITDTLNSEIDIIVNNLTLQIKTILANGHTNEQQDYLNGLLGAVSGLDQEIRNFRIELTDRNKWDAIGAWTQGYRAIANLLGKILGPAGDPPNAVLAIKMAVGDLDMTPAELIRMQFEGLVKIWDPLTNFLIENESRMLRVFGHNLSGDETKIKPVLGQTKQLLVDAVPKNINKLIGAARNMANGNLEAAGLEIADLPDNMQNRSLIRETVKNMGKGGVNLATEINAMRTKKYRLDGLNNQQILQKIFDSNEVGLDTDPQDLNNIADDQLLTALHDEKHQTTVEMYRLLNAINQAPNELGGLLAILTQNDGELLGPLTKLLESFTIDGKLTTTEQESIFQDMELIFKNFEACEEYLLKKKIITEITKTPALVGRLIRRSSRPQIQLASVVESFNFAYSPAMMIQEIFPAIHHHFGHGTQEIASLVTLQFLAGPMVAHAFKKFIVDPEINRQVEEFGEVRNLDSIIQRILLMAATSPLSDNGLVVNVGSTILHQLYTDGVMKRDEYLTGIHRLFQGAIEAGDGLKTGGPASAPFTDEPFGATEHGWKLTWANFFANVPFDGESKEIDVIKNILMYRGISSLTRFIPNVDLPTEITEPLYQTGAAAGALGFKAVEYFNPALLTRPFARALRVRGDGTRDQIVFDAIRNLQLTYGNISSQEN